jgi:hypothetical protein
MKLKINWEHKRVKHALERMWLRGISAQEVRETLAKGKKSFQRETGLMLSIFRHLIVVYDEKIYISAKIRKVFPVTVKVT